jgi:hypothetical protein
MSKQDKVDYEAGYDYPPDTAVVAAVNEKDYRHDEIYDPSKESFWTRAGLNWESYKPAPGHTGGQIIQGGTEDPEELERRRT